MTRKQEVEPASQARKSVFPRAVPVLTSGSCKFIGHRSVSGQVQIFTVKKIEDPAPDLHSYPSRPAEASDPTSPEGAEQSINPSAHGEDDTVRDLQSYPLASSNRPGR